MKKVCVIGLGYIGLPTAIVLAEHGLKVVGFDIDKQKVQGINAGEPIIDEPGLIEKLNTVLKNNMFYAVNTIEQANYFIIAVPTPFTEDKKSDLSYVTSAMREIARVIKKGDVVILESTVPVGTTELLARDLTRLTGFEVGKEVFVAHCPERVLPGNIFYELVHNARIIGGIGERSVELAREMYGRFVQGNMSVTDSVTAELVKLIENSSRDVSIAFANQVASMSYEVGRDPYQVIELANKHPRVNILQPSCGVGGHCIAVDPWFLIDMFKEHTALLKTARDINNEKPKQVLSTILKRANDWISKNKKRCIILVLGVTYKPDIDDLRESPALFIAQQLTNKCDEMTDILVCEPHVPADVLDTWFAPEHIVSFNDGIKRADIIVALVAHKQFKDGVRTSGIGTKKFIDYCGLRTTPRYETKSKREGKVKHFYEEHVSLVLSKSMTKVKEQTS